jgi:transcriptional regulator with XRE-family HTH domain
MKQEFTEFEELVQSNIRAFRTRSGLSHAQVAGRLSELGVGTATPSQSQNNERARALPYGRIAALAQVLNTEPFQFFVRNPPGLEAGAALSGPRTPDEETLAALEEQDTEGAILAPEEGETGEEDDTDDYWPGMDGQS